MVDWEYILEEIGEVAYKMNLNSKETEVFMEFIVCRFGETVPGSSYLEEWAERIKYRKAYRLGDSESEMCLEKAGYDELPFPEYLRGD